MNITGAARVAGVAGWPVAHSLSPTLHNTWIAAAKLDAIYVPFAIAPETASAAFRSLPALAIAGVNVTVPHKETALSVADVVTERARIIGAANLLTVDRDGGLRADNTDALGFLYGLEKSGADASGPCVILGAGGAARAVVAALADAGCAQLRIVNRSVERARDLAALAEQLGISATTHAFDAVGDAAKGARLLVNATSLGLKDGAPLDLPIDIVLGGLAPGAAVYDLIYTPLETPLLRDARAAGLTAIDGLNMLIGQARPSFEALFGVAAPASVDARALLEAKLADAET